MNPAIKINHYGLDGQDSVSSRGTIAVFATSYSLAMGPIQPFLMVQGEYIRPEHKVDPMPPSGAEI
jgi:hypothetical protein